MTLTQAVKRLKEVRAELDEAKKCESDLRKEFDHLSIEVIPDLMAEDDVTNVTVSGVGRVSVRGDMRCNVPADKKDLLRTWLVDHGHGSLISDTVNASTLKAFIKEQIAEGKPYPDDLISVHPYSRAVLTATTK